MSGVVNGVVIWAESDCRSMMGIYRELIRQLPCPVLVALYRKKGKNDLREKTGFSHEEFDDIPMIEVGEDWNKGLELLDSHRGYGHLFAMYQSQNNFRRLLLEIARRGDRIGILSESPCIMVNGIKGLVKETVYLRYILPQRVKPIIRASDFIINLSGNSTRLLSQLGWHPWQIQPFGYYPPPIVGSNVVERATNKNFCILVTGIMTWHRAPDVVVEALKLLKLWRIDYRAIFTQRGPMQNLLKARCEESGLDVNFPGVVGIDKLIQMYQECSVYVGAGRSEPWGMRLNDALNCGSPLLVSRGMGGVKLVDDYGCGLTFNVDDAVDLAYKLRRLATDNETYCRCARNAVKAVSSISPRNKAAEIKDILLAYNWL